MKGQESVDARTERKAVNRRRVRGHIGRAGLGVVALAVLASAAACGAGGPASPSASASTSAAPTQQKQPQVLAKGTIATVSASSVTLTTAKGETRTFSLAPDVVVKQGTHKVPPSTVAPGARVVLYAAGNGTATTPGGGPIVGKIVIKSLPGGATPTPAA